MRRAASALFVFAACSSRSDDNPRPPAPPPTLVAPVDAAPAPGITELPSYDPAAGLHLDDDPESGPGRGGPSIRNRRTLEILLRSSPPGAAALVDGQPVGRTPTYWEGDFTGREREFTFVLKDHALARYRFVPITNGIIHARLDPVLPGEPGPAVLPLAPPVQPPTPRRPAPPPDARVEPPDAAATTAADAAPAAPTDEPPVGPTP